MEKPFEIAILDAFADRLGEGNVVGVHESYLEGEESINHSFLIHSRNFAPLYGIDEECATGTSNAGLTALLYSDGKIKENQICKIIQGEYMERMGRIYSKVLASNGGMSIFVGGNAVYNACDKEGAKY